jgi:hypothetical protein
MKVRLSILVVYFLSGLTACSLDDENPKTSIYSHSFDFSGINPGWTHGFSDYPAGPDDSARFELKYAYTNLPSNLGNKSAFMLSGNNQNGDLFMFLKTKLSGLEPHLTYTLTINIDLASSAKSGSSNNSTYGPPGESVYVKVGATATEPKSVIEGGKFIMNIDKGNGAEGGEDMVVIGNIAVPAEGSGYSIKTLNNSYSSPIKVSASSKGELWIIVGTDATINGVTTLYYSKINVVLSRAE